MLYLALALSSATLPAAGTTPASLEPGFAGALRGCEEWVLNPASWADGPEPFLKTVGLGKTIGLVESIPDIAQPPPAWRRANHYWRINSTPQSGYFLVVSDRLPMCHITGGGSVDFQPVIATVLVSPEFSSRWELVEEQVSGDLASSRYRLRESPQFGMTISRAAAPGGRTDRVQVQVSASFDLGK